MKKRMNLLIILILCLGSILVACTNSTGGKTETSEKELSEESKLTIVNGKIEPAVTITTVRGIDSTTTFKEGETYEDNVHTRWAKEKLGVELETLWSSSLMDGSYETKLKLMLSSGEKLPDVIATNNLDTISQFIESGKVMSVDEAFEKYASGTWKQILADQPSAWQPFISDSKKYAIPIVDQPIGTESVLWIRQDWLDKLGLEAPKTLDELEVVMDAFVNKDPDGNGMKDTLGTDFALKDQMIGYPIGDVSWVFGAYGTIPDQWNKDKDGKLVFGSIEPGAKDALATLKTWMEKGYISKDVALTDWNKVIENVVSGKVGLVSGPSWFAGYPGSIVKASNPNAVFKPYPTPEGPDGEKGQTVGKPSSSAIMISKEISQESLEAFFHYYNSLYESTVSEDPFYLKDFQEGYDYVIVDGNKVTDNDKFPEGQMVGPTFKYSISGQPFKYPEKSLEANLKVARGEELTKQEISAFDGGYPNVAPLTLEIAQATTVQFEQSEFDMPNYFQGTPTPGMVSRNDFLKKMQLDSFTSIIYGKSSLDEFDKFVEKWKSSGGDQITEEVNDWYKSVQ